jgi:hypothetical protein
VVHVTAAPSYKTSNANPHIGTVLSLTRNLAACCCQLADPAAFDYSPFWRGLLRECSSAARGLEEDLSEEGLQAASQMDEQPENLLVS